MIYFADEIVNLNHKLEEINSEEKVYKDEDLVRQVYDFIAECFLIPFGQNESTILKRHEWKCGYCSNDKFCCIIGGEETKTINKCRLCGIAVRESIIWRIK